MLYSDPGRERISIMRDTKNWIIAGLCIAFCVALFWDVQDREIAEAYRLEKEQAQRHIKKQIDSVNRQIRAKDEQLLKLMRELREAEMVAEIAEEKAIKIKAKYDQIRFRPARDNQQRDSLLRTILHN
jgi:septal ring factor EnvC (AmiA/AmiB activator)